MKKFIQDLSLTVVSIAIISLIINISIYQLVNPIFKVNHKAAIAKYIHLKKYGEQYDTLFIGSSRVALQIDSELYDSLTGHKSFNCGVPGQLSPQGAIFLDELIKLPSLSNLKNIFWEFAPFVLVGEKFNSEGIYYNLNLALGVEALIVKVKNEMLEEDEMVNFFQAIFKKFTRAPRLLFHKNTFNMKWHTRNQGFYSLGEEMLGKKPETSPMVLHRKYFLENSGEIIGKYKDTTKKKQSLELVDAEAVLYHQLVSRIFKECEARGIKLFPIISPLLDYRTVYIGHSRFLDEAKLRLLDFNSMEEYPEFYRIENVFDKTHLNLNGTELYTRAVASKYLDFI